MTEREWQYTRSAITAEFHYFRIPQQYWQARFAQLADLGFIGISMYVPWNWHKPNPDKRADFTGQSVAERDLIGAIQAIADNGMVCILRPGPFITAEWLDGGLPSWLWLLHPEVLSLNANGYPASTGLAADSVPYPAITYRHPEFRNAARGWLEEFSDAIMPFLWTRGGPVVSIQIDDEPSYWQRLGWPLALDYNPILIEPEEHDQVISFESRYANWLVTKYEGIDALNKIHQRSYRSSKEVQPPRESMKDIGQIQEYLDWFMFKLAEINSYVSFLYRTLQDSGIDVHLSMLQPYLLPIQGASFLEYADDEGLKLQLTNECYLNLFRPSTCSEEKVGNIVACHEAYNMWRSDESGPPTCAELQGSLASYISPGEMELLYAITVARGIKGMNIFTAVGGHNPPNYEHRTGRNYDISAPVSSAGDLRPHASVISRLSHMLDSFQAAENFSNKTIQGPADLVPLYDVYLGALRSYETMPLAIGTAEPPGSSSAGLSGESPTTLSAGLSMVNSLFSTGELGLSGSSGLPSLMSVASVSFGWVDMEAKNFSPRPVGSQLANDTTIFTPSLNYLPRIAQQRLLEHALNGGHVILMPAIPYLDENMYPCTILAESVMSVAAIQNYKDTLKTILMTRSQPDTSVPDESFTLVETSAGSIFAVPGKLLHLGTVAPDAKILARDARTHEVCAFRKTVNSGSVTVIGFSLQYSPNEDDAEANFLLSLIETSGNKRWAWADAPPALAMQAASGKHGLLCVVNPTKRSVTTNAYYTPLWSGETPLWRGEHSAIRERVGPVHFHGQGARLLPLFVPIAGGHLYHSSWELTSNEAVSGDFTPGMSTHSAEHRHASTARLTFSTPVPGPGEIAFSSRMKLLSCRGGSVKSIVEEPWGLRALISAEAPSIHVELEVVD